MARDDELHYVTTIIQFNLPNLRSSLNTTIELLIGKQSSVMPRVVQPGGKSGKIRVRYKPRRKLAIIAAVRRLMEEEKLSLVKASEVAQVHYSLISKWTKESDILRNAIKSKKKSRHTGPSGQLQPVQDQLLRFIFEQREMGMPINILMIVLYASTISTLFSGKSIKARCLAVRRFVTQHSLVYRMGTHESQRHPEEVKEEASDFLSEMRKMVALGTCWWSRNKERRKRGDAKRPLARQKFVHKVAQGRNYSIINDNHGTRGSS